MSRFTTVWPQHMFPWFFLQKLEEFLFCMEEIHPEVGDANTVNVGVNVISVNDVFFALTLGHSRIYQLTLTQTWPLSSFFNCLINTDLHEKPGLLWQTCLSLHNVLYLFKGEFCWACVLRSAPPCFKLIQLYSFTPGRQTGQGHRHLMRVCPVQVFKQ